MSQKTYTIKVLPASGGGMPYEETVQATNPPQAEKIVKARIPDGWNICYPQEVR